MHGARPLRWDEGLAAAAAGAAASCGLAAAHASAKEGAGQSVFMATGDTAASATEEAVVAAWYSESLEPGYDFAASGVQLHALGFTQLVWRSTTSVGCGWCRDAGNVTHQPTALAVCRYMPAGNIPGLFRANVLPQVPDDAADAVCALGPATPQPPGTPAPTHAPPSEPVLEAGVLTALAVAGGALAVLCVTGFCCWHNRYWKRHKKAMAVRKDSRKSFADLKRARSGKSDRPAAPQAASYAAPAAPPPADWAPPADPPAAQTDAEADAHPPAGSRPELGA
eukprot:TRINITY_DN15829_c2_g2_i1.p1 TRINITY_DN15829_c2_g2~~TRINITY_DN15829_c2_g2_i1.p1  ORF type:complete len:328 (+),score=97.54 TRINITY_DN15829_c2_g2_i1:143-985(+)